MTTLRPAMRHRDSRPTARPGHHELPSAGRGPDGPRHSAPRPPSGGRRQAHPERLRLRFMLPDVLLNTKQPGECQLETTFSGRSQTPARSHFPQQQSGCRASDATARSPCSLGIKCTHANTFLVAQATEVVLCHVRTMPAAAPIPTGPCLPAGAANGLTELPRAQGWLLALPHRSQVQARQSGSTSSACPTPFQDLPPSYSAKPRPHLPTSLPSDPRPPAQTTFQLSSTCDIYSAPILRLPTGGTTERWGVGPAQSSSRAGGGVQGVSVPRCECVQG